MLAAWMFQMRRGRGRRVIGGGSATGICLLWVCRSGATGRLFVKECVFRRWHGAAQPPQGGNRDATTGGASIAASGNLVQLPLLPFWYPFQPLRAAHSPRPLDGVCFTLARLHLMQAVGPQRSVILVSHGVSPAQKVVKQLQAVLNPKCLARECSGSFMHERLSGVSHPDARLSSRALHAEKPPPISARLLISVGRSIGSSQLARLAMGRRFGRHQCRRVVIGMA